MEFTIPRKLWEHPCPHETEMYKFMKKAELATGRVFSVCQARFLDSSYDSHLTRYCRIMNLSTSGLATVAPSSGISHSTIFRLYIVALSQILLWTKKLELTKFPNGLMVSN